MAFNDPRAPARARLLHPMTGRKYALLRINAEILPTCRLNPLGVGTCGALLRGFRSCFEACIRLEDGLFRRYKAFH